MSLDVGILKELTGDLTERLNRLGIMYRLFGRGKTADSINHKIQANPGKYNSGKKIQDGIGLRIVFYFLEDVRFFSNWIKTPAAAFDKCIDESDSEQELEKKLRAIKDKDLKLQSHEVFQPQRLNYVFRMREKHSAEYRLSLEEMRREFKNPGYTDLIDDTYEVQFRSVLSEGWHEVEHDLRYKCREAWETHVAESRALNGIYAALETNERAMIQLFDHLAYSNYCEGDWQSMIRNHFRLRMDPYQPLSSSIVKMFDADTREAKNILKVQRHELQEAIAKVKGKYRITMDNIVFLANRISRNPSSSILDIEPELLVSKLNESLPILE